VGAAHQIVVLLVILLLPLPLGLLLRRRRGGLRRGGGGGAVGVLARRHGGEVGFTGGGRGGRRRGGDGRLTARRTAAGEGWSWGLSSWVDLGFFFLRREYTSSFGLKVWSEIETGCRPCSLFDGPGRAVLKEKIYSIIPAPRVSGRLGPADPARQRCNKFRPV
jgi:hypothetical protein